MSSLPKSTNIQDNEFEYFVTVDVEPRGHWRMHIHWWFSISFIRWLKISRKFAVLEPLAAEQTRGQSWAINHFDENFIVRLLRDHIDHRLS